MKTMWSHCVSSALYFVLICGTVFVQSESVMEAFTKDGVVTDVIDNVPPQLLKISYGDLEIQPGKVITPTQAQNIPKVEWEADSDSFYTLIMNDPDAPSREKPIYGEWHHWLLTNIPGNDISKAETSSAYVGAGPPAKTGLHRYVFLVFKQLNGRQEFANLQKLTNTSGEGRAKWKVRDFAKDYGLGEAVAGNFFQAEYDSYCDELYKQLGL